jgi:tRNA (guanosine-2'-O-)-methyltransferase
MSELNEGLKYLSGFISDHKLKYINEVLEFRIRHLSVILEDIHKSHNASAVIRTCDAVRVQDLHIIENHSKFKINQYVTRGSSQWVNLYRYNYSEVENTVVCYEKLKAEGYKICATTPSSEGKLLEELDLLDLNDKIALSFGNEFSGLSPYALERADLLVKIPMFGFTKSYNISVTAALCLYVLVQKLHKSEKKWQITEEEKEEIKLTWYKKIVKRSDIHTRFFLSKNPYKLL